MSPYNTPAYHSTSPTSHGLPSDEYKYLKRQQEKSRLEWHLAKKHLLPSPSSSSSSCFSSSPSFPSSSTYSSSSFPSSLFCSSFSSSSSSLSSPATTSYHAPHNPPPPNQTHRHPPPPPGPNTHVKNATRKALASVFDSSTDDMYEEWLRSRYDDRVYRRVSSRRDIDEYYNSDRARLNRGSGESIRMRYHNMNGYGSRASADDVGGPRLGSKFSFDSLDDA